MSTQRGYLFGASALVVVGLLLRLPVLQTGFMVDDYAQLAMMRGDYPVARGPLELFTFSDGSSAEVDTLRHAGFFPWWSADDLKLSMFRPLSCALMWLDRALFGQTPEAAFGAHLHGFLWWAAMALALAWLLRELLPTGPALLALAMFVSDDGHVLPLAWIALRNSLVSSTFALLALRFQLRAQVARRGLGRGQLAAALACALLALAAGEYALPFLAYAAAFELARDAPLRARLRSVALLATLGLAHLSLRSALGFGSRSSDMYVDPSGSLAGFFEAARTRTLALIGDLALGLPSGFWTHGGPFARPEWHGDLRPFRQVHAAAGVVGVGVLLALTLLARRIPITRAVWPMVPAALLAIVPVLGTFPDARLLIAAQVGVTAALAGVTFHVLGELRAAPRSVPRWLAAAGVSALVLVQVGSSLVVNDIQVRVGGVLPAVVRRSLLMPPFDDRMIGAQHLLLLGAADAITTIYLPLLRRAHGRPAPASCHLLTAAHTRFKLRRESERTFTLQRMDDALTVGDLYGSAFSAAPPRVGVPVDVGALRVTALQVRGGQWRKARFEHDLSLDDPQLVLLLQTLSGLVRLAPPAIGGEVVLPAPMPPLALAGQ